MVDPPTQQIRLKVRLASVDRNASKQLEINIFSTGAANTIGTVTTGQFSPPKVSTPSGTSTAAAAISNALNIFLFRPDINLGATIEAMEQQRLVECLSEPNIFAEDGILTYFLASVTIPHPTLTQT